MSKNSIQRVAIRGLTFPLVCLLLGSHPFYR